MKNVIELIEDLENYIYYKKPRKEGQKEEEESLSKQDVLIRWSCDSEILLLDIEVRNITTALSRGKLSISLDKEERLVLLTEPGSEYFRIGKTGAEELYDLELLGPRIMVASTAESTLTEIMELFGIKTIKAEIAQSKKESTG